MTESNAARIPPEATPQGAPGGAAAPQPAAPQFAMLPPPWWARPPRRSIARRVFTGVMVLAFAGSIILNCYLLAYLSMQLESPIAATTIRDGEKAQTVAVYCVAGMIGGKAAEDFASFFDEVAGDPNVKAVVIRVESGGGGVTPSDQIHSMVKRLKDKGKKVVVSMGGVAASGGYYISAPADEIIAEPTTYTGSIGVVAVRPVIKETLSKIGVEMVVIKSSHAEEWKDEGSPFERPTPEQRQHVQEELDKIQARFEKVVTDGRGGKLKPYQARPTTMPSTRPAPKYEAFNGKVYLAADARELGLIDGEGYLDDAIDRAAQLAGLKEARVVRYERRVGLVGRIMDGLPGARLNAAAEMLEELHTSRVLLVWNAD